MNIYESIEKRTGGDIYVGVVGPVRSGKSTFIKKFMEALVIPNISDRDKRVRAIDELPQSAAGKTVMTTQPNFIPRQRADIIVGDNRNLRVRLVDCVGYMVAGARGDTEEGKPRMVKTPWFKQAIPFEKAARIGTRKVIAEHSTLGIVITTDGSFTDIPRESYARAEDKVIAQLKSLNKPFVVLLNSAMPDSALAKATSKSISEKHGLPVIIADCTELDKEKIEEILRGALTRFPVKEIVLTLPRWLMMQPKDFGPKAEILAAIKENFETAGKINDIAPAAQNLLKSRYITDVRCTKADYGTGCAVLETVVEKNLFYNTLQSIAGVQVDDDRQLMKLVQSLVYAKTEYDKLAPALRQVEATGYGIVMPGRDKLRLEEPEVVKQGGKYGIRLTASAPSLHIIKADISTTVSPIIGNEGGGEDMVSSMMKNFENDPLGIWQSNLFGNSLQELVNQGLNAKLLNVPPEARAKLTETIERVVNEGCRGLICIIL